MIESINSTDMSDTTPKIYAAIAAVQAAVAKEGISKDRSNVQQGYKFRGIDDIYNAVAPLLAANGLCIMPSYANRTKEERTTQKGGVLFYVTVEGTFDFVATSDGSRHTVKTFGEAMDSGDKATNKAMSAAYKYACMQTFCIPTEGDNDADTTTHEVAPAAAPASKAAPVKQALKMATSNTRSAALHRLGCQEEGVARNTLHSYLVALGWLENEKAIEQWPTRFVPITADELEAVKSGLAKFSVDGTVTRPYAPHGLDPAMLVSHPVDPPKASPAADTGPVWAGTTAKELTTPAAPGWRDYVLTFGRDTKGRTLGSFKDANIRDWILNFPKEDFSMDAEGVRHPFPPTVAAENKLLRAALHAAADEFANQPVTKG